MSLRNLHNYGLSDLFEEHLIDHNIKQFTYSDVISFLIKKQNTVHRSDTDAISIIRNLIERSLIIKYGSSHFYDATFYYPANIVKHEE